MRGNPRLGRESPAELERRTAKWKITHSIWGDQARHKGDEEERPDTLARLRTANTLGDVLNILDRYEKTGW